MGWETLAMVGFQMLGNAGAASSARSQAKAAVKEGQYRAENKARDTLRTTGKLTTNFLQSGLTLEGGPTAAISQAFSAGYRDIGRIVDNANTESSNIMSAQRTKALEGWGKSMAGSSIGTEIGGAVESGVSSANQWAGSLFDPSPMGPYQGPLDSGFWG